MFKILFSIYYVVIVSMGALIGVAVGGTFRGFYGGLYGLLAFLTVEFIFVGPLWIKAWIEGGRRNRANGAGGDQKTWKNQESAIQRYVELVQKEVDA